MQDSLSRDPAQVRLLAELKGLAMGIVADGVVSQAEAEFLCGWLEAHARAGDNPVVGPLRQRVEEMLRDRTLDFEESAELLVTLRHFTEGGLDRAALALPPGLPLDEPPAPLVFPGQRYCFTGTFCFGTHRACQAAVAARGARVGPLGRGTNVLVVGLYATPDWAEAAYGQRIRKALDLREDGVAIAIVGEEHWARHL